MDHTQTKWRELCYDLEVPGDLTEKWWLCVGDSYQSKGRHYHTLTHISSMLNHLEEFKEKITCYEEVSLAIYFHDIVYEPKEPGNEEKSAALFMEFASECLGGIPVKVNPNRVHDMIVQTKHHQTEFHLNGDLNIFGREDLHYLLDFDMAILGQSREVYGKYSEAIRQEYIHIEEQFYKQRRKAVLQKFLTIPKIFSTQDFYQLYESVARENLKAEILSLS